MLSRYFGIKKNSKDNVGYVSSLTVRNLTNKINKLHETFMSVDCISAWVFIPTGYGYYIYSTLVGGPLTFTLSLIRRPQIHNPGTI